MAEGVGFDPTVRLPVQQFSSPPYSIRSHSTASAHMQAPLGNHEAEDASGRLHIVGGHQRIAQITGVRATHDGSGSTTRDHV